MKTKYCVLAAEVLLLGGIGLFFQVKSYVAGYRLIRVDKLQLSVSRKFEIQKLDADSWIVGKIDRNSDVLIIQRPSSKVRSQEELDKKAIKEQQWSQKHPGEIHKVLRTFSRSIGPFSMRLVEGTTAEPGILSYAAYTSISGHFFMMQIVLKGGIDHPSALGKSILRSIASIRYVE